MTSGLGKTQRAVMLLLKANVPINPSMCAAILGTAPSLDTGYYAATLVRLAEQGVAAQVNDTWGYVRGPRWHETMTYYHQQGDDDND